MTDQMILDIHEQFMRYYKSEFPPFIRLAKEVGIHAMTLRKFMDDPTNSTQETCYRIENYLKEHND